MTEARSKRHLLIPVIFILKLGISKWIRLSQWYFSFSLCVKHRNTLQYVNVFPVSFLTEIRNHGVGYYQFSTSEEQRQEQMKTLDKLREQVLTGKQKIYIKSCEHFDTCTRLLVNCNPSDIFPRDLPKNVAWRYVKLRYMGQVAAPSRSHVNGSVPFDRTIEQMTETLPRDQKQ